MDKKFRFSTPDMQEVTTCSKEGCEETEGLCPGCGYCDEHHGRQLASDTGVGSNIIRVAIEAGEPEKESAIRRTVLFAMAQMMTNRPSTEEIADLMYDALKGVSLASAKAVKQYILLGVMLNTTRPVTVFELLMELAENDFKANHAIAQMAMDIDATTISMFIIQGILGVAETDSATIDKFLPQGLDVTENSTKEEKYDAIERLVLLASKWAQQAAEVIEKTTDQINDAIEHSKGQNK